MTSDVRPGVKRLFKYIKATDYNGGRVNTWFLDNVGVWRIWYHQIRKKP